MCIGILELLRKFELIYNDNCVGQKDLNTSIYFTPIIDISFTIKLITNL